MANESANRFQVLGHDQVIRLHEVMQASVPIHGRGNFPTLDVKLADLVHLVRQNLKNDGIKVHDVRINGGVASYVIGGENVQPYNDLDLIFGVDLSTPSDLQKIKNAALDSLLNFMPDCVNKTKMSSCSLKEGYVHKLVKVCNEHDRWSLVSLSNNFGKNVELKFVDRMKRQFEFTVDSFQIILDSILTFYEVSATPMSEHFYPTVVAESVYGNFEEALHHLNNKYISTRQPEEIRGGGLLKYCNLLTHGYTPAPEIDIVTLERYMCSRFFIDFSDINQQRLKLDGYLANHFRDEEELDLRYEYLMTVYRVVDGSTICLMGHERRQTLNLIQCTAQQVLMEQEQRVQSKNFIHFDQLNNLVIDQVYYGPYNGFNQFYNFTYGYVPQLFNGSNSNGSCSPCPSTPSPKYLECS